MPSLPRILQQFPGRFADSWNGYWAAASAERSNFDPSKIRGKIKGEMMRNKLKQSAVAILFVLPTILMAGCGDRGDDRDRGLSRAEVEEIVQSAMAETPDPTPGLSQEDVEGLLSTAVAGVPTTGPGLHQDNAAQLLEDPRYRLPQSDPDISRAEIEEIVAEAIAEAVEREPRLSRGEVQRIARNVVASIPLRSAPAEYTKFFVENAISKYDSEGLEATLNYYNRIESVDGQWYVFIIDANDRVIAHYNPRLLNADLKGPFGIDRNSYPFGQDMLSATEEGKWVSYVFRNPEGGVPGGDFASFEIKNIWVVKHGGLLFASGWFVEADQFTQSLVAAAVGKYRSVGLNETLEYFAGPETALAGLEATIEYYNDSQTVPGEWFAFIADGTDTLVGHNVPELIGRSITDLYLFRLVTHVFNEDGIWVAVEAIDSETGSMESMRAWVVKYDEVTFGSGWYNSEPGS